MYVRKKNGMWEVTSLITPEDPRKMVFKMGAQDTTISLVHRGVLVILLNEEDYKAGESGNPLMAMLEIITRRTIESKNYHILYTTGQQHGPYVELCELDFDELELIRDML